MIFPGKQFEFDTLFMDEAKGEPRKFGPIDLYQIGELSCVSGYEVPPHKQWCHEISYVINGEGLFTTDNETDLMIEGDIHLAPAGTVHAIRTVSNYDLRFAYIGFNFNEEVAGNADGDLRYLQDFFSSPATFKAVDNNELLMPIFRNLDELYRKPIFYPLMVETYLIQLVVLICRSFIMKSPDIAPMPAITEKGVGRGAYAVMRHVDNHIFEKIDIQQVAYELGYNSSYLSSLFKRKTGMTIQRYISNRKIQEAIELMKYGRLSVAQTAQRLNYANIQSFNKAFKRTMDCAPTEYIRKCNKS